MIVQLCGTRAYVPTVASVAMSVIGRVLGSSGAAGTAPEVRSSAHSEVLKRFSPRGPAAAFWLDETLPVVEETDDTDDEGVEGGASRHRCGSIVGVSPVNTPVPQAASVQSGHARADST